MNRLFKIAVIRNTVPVVAHFIRNRDELNDVDSDGMTLLMYAAANNNHEICQMLIASGADPSITTPDGKTAAIIAQSLGCNEALEVIREYNSVPVGMPQTNGPELEENEWLPVPDMPDGITRNFLSDKMRHLNRSVSVHVPADEAENWMQDLGDYAETVSGNANELCTRKSNGNDPIVEIFAWSIANGRVFETNLRKFSKLLDDEAETYHLLHLLCGQADIVTDYIDPVIAATGEPLPYTENELEEHSDQAHELRDLYHHFLHNDLDPLDAIQSETEKHKPLSAKEEKQLARMMEEGYLEVVNVILTHPKLLMLLREMASTAKFNNISPLGHKSGDKPSLKPERASIPANRSHKRDTTSWTYQEGDFADESVADISSEYHEEIRKIGNDYSLIAAKFGNNKSNEKTLTMRFRSIAERLYHVGIPVAHISRLHMTLEALKNNFLRAKAGLEQILSGVTFVSQEERDFLYQNPSPSVRLGHILDRLQESEPDFVYGVKHFTNMMNTVLLRTGTSATGFKTLLKKYDSGMKRINKSREIFVKRNLRLVRHVARQYRNSMIPEADLFQEGVTGLLSAIDRYQHKKANKFGTYAIYWIKQAITRAILNKSRLIRVPVHISQYLYRFENIREIFFYYENGGRDLLFLSKLMQLPPATVKRLFAVPQAFLWLDDPDKTCELEALQNGEPCQEETVQAVDEELEITVREILDTLTGRESTVLKMRFGMDQPEAETLEEIGHKLKLTRERIRQIESKALARLRHPSRSERLRVFL